MRYMIMESGMWKEAAMWKKIVMLLAVLSMSPAVAVAEDLGSLG
ncbi:hypothetical protein W02_35730 [Nitrospira sp. KM1]|nr:hypothetical protein W02_35730 [Nitrospira sp. KM1]